LGGGSAIVGDTEEKKKTAVDLPPAKDPVNPKKNANEMREKGEISRENSARENQKVLLSVTRGGQKWDY